MTYLTTMIVVTEAVICTSVNLCRTQKGVVPYYNGTIALGFGFNPFNACLQPFLPCKIKLRKSVVFEI